MSGVAIHGMETANTGLFKGTASGEMTLSNNYFGLKLDGTVGVTSVSSTGISLSGDDVQVGFPGGIPNYFAGLDKGLQIFGAASDITVKGNVFGVTPNGTVAGHGDADIQLRSNINNAGPSNITIGGTPNNSTPDCDDGCNVIAAAGGSASDGISFATSGTDAATTNVSIIGNHIGLDEAGTGATGTGTLIDIATGDDVTVEGNHLAGGEVGVSATTSGSSPVIQNNSFGTNSAETEVADGTGGPSIGLESSSTAPALVQGNLIAKAESEGNAAISITGVGATLDENTIGLGGAPESGGDDGIVLQGIAHTVEDNRISETGSDAIELSDMRGADIRNNQIGHEGPIGGHGIVMRPASGNTTENVIGAAEPAAANEFSDVGGDAIRIEGNGQDENELLVNLGRSGDDFVDLVGDEGLGNGASGPNNGIEAPKVKKVKEKEVRGEGEPGAKVWIYRSRSGKGEVPTGLKEFLGTKKVKNDGSWKFKPKGKIKGKHVITAMQTSGDGNSSELTKGKKRN
jgi:hypothetical protein